MAALSRFRQCPLPDPWRPLQRAAARPGTTPWPGVSPAAPIRRGVDIIQHCEVTGIRIEGGRIVGVETTRGPIRGEEGRRSRSPAIPAQLAAMAGCAADRNPCLQAFVSEALKPLIDSVVTFGAGHFYISQSDKGGLVFGGDSTGTTPTPSAATCRSSRTRWARRR
jgi:glycine/D-amino acid oxidase-like deaminating enzyme